MILMSSVLAACVVKRFRFDLLQFKSTFPLKTGCSIEQILQGSCTSIELSYYIVYVAPSAPSHVLSQDTRENFVLAVLHINYQ